MADQLQKTQERVDWLRLQYGQRYAAADCSISFDRVRRRLERAERTLARLLLRDKGSAAPTAPRNEAEPGETAPDSGGGHGDDTSTWVDQGKD